MGQAAHEIVPYRPAKVFLGHGQRSFFWNSNYQKHPNNKIIIRESRKKTQLNSIGPIVFCGGWFVEMVLSAEIRMSWQGHRA